jgi:hypothetical protein
MPLACQLIVEVPAGLHWVVMVKDGGAAKKLSKLMFGATAAADTLIGETNRTRAISEAARRSRVRLTEPLLINRDKPLAAHRVPGRHPDADRRCSTAS